MRERADIDTLSTYSLVLSVDYNEQRDMPEYVFNSLPVIFISQLQVFMRKQDDHTA